MTEFPSIFNFWRDECVSCLFLKMFSQVTDDESYFKFFFSPLYWTVMEKDPSSSPSLSTPHHCVPTDTVP